MNFVVNRLGGEHDSAGPTDAETVSDVARQRWRAVPSWRPLTLAAVRADRVAGAD